MEIFGHTPIQLILFYILYGVTGAVSAIAALYLLLRRSNVFAPDITPPVRLRRWATAYFAVEALSHVWWLLFYIYDRNLHFRNIEVLSAAYVAVVMLDCVMMLTTIAGTLLSMLQDRRQSVWPVLVAMIPFAAFGGVLMVHPNRQFMLIAFAYLLLLYVLFTGYMVFAIRRYGRWLNDNYADLENKKVWLSQAVTLSCMLLFFLYVLVADLFLISLMHVVELMLFVLLLWRVETLPTLPPDDLNPDDLTPDGLTTGDLTPDRLTPDRLTPDRCTPGGCPPDGLTAGGCTPAPSPKERDVVGASDEQTGATASEEAGNREGKTSEPPRLEKGSWGDAIYVDIAQIEQLLAEQCVATQLYLQHDLSLQQLSLAIGTNRTYLSQYFSRQGITYNTYINNLRINHFIRRCQELAAEGQPIAAQQLASDSGYRSYSTFSLAFKQRTGQSVTAWIRDMGNDKP